MKTIKSLLRYAMLLIVVVIGGSCLTSCNSFDDNPTVKEVTLEDALKEGNIVVLTFSVDGTDITKSLQRES